MRERQPRRVDAGVGCRASAQPAFLEPNWPCPRVGYPVAVTKHEELNPLIPSGLEVVVAAVGVASALAVLALVVWLVLRSRPDARD